ncbi:MAG: hypothetical protein QXD12_05795, partial [Candidatus Nezhaarchaeales archaeon]
MKTKLHELLIIVRPSKFRSANVMAALTLQSIALSQDVKCVLADLPQGFEAFLKQYEKVEEALKMAIKLGLLYWPESIVKAYEPIVSCLSRLMRENVRVVCYLDSSDLERERRLAFKISRLVLRALIKRVDNHDLSEWVQVLNEYAFGGRMTFNRLIYELEGINEPTVAILAGLEGFQYARKLESKQLNVRVE